jgi:HlyD family secretion protein
MVVNVRGSGTLVPEDIRWLPAPADGRVEKVLTSSVGNEVQPDTIIVVLSNPQMEQQQIDSDLQLKAAEADQENLRVRLKSDDMTQRSAVAQIKAEYSQARLQLDTDEALGKQGLVPELTLKLSRVHTQDLADRLKVEEDRLAVTAQSAKAQVNAQQAKVDQFRALAKLKHDQLEALKVRAGTRGVLQQVLVQVGQQAATGANLARVADPASLKAELKIAETQIKDVQIGQPVEVDTRNGVIQARVSRMDPAAQNGTVTVDASLIGPLPPSARVDLTVDGSIETARINDCLYVGRPASGQAQTTIGMFKLEPDGVTALRTQVSLGKTAVSTVEILNGLREGDRVILSDTQSVDAYNRILVK